MKLRAAVKASLRLLSSRDRRRLLLATCIQILTSLLDLVGVLLLGLVGALAVTTVQGQAPPAVVSDSIDLLGLQDLSDQSILVFFSLAAASVLLLKSVLSSLLLRRVFLFLASRQAVVSSRLARELLARPLTFLQRRSSQETAYALVQGAGAATLVVLGQAVVIVSEASLLILLGLALLFISPWIAVGSIVFFALVAFALQYSLGNWASESGRKMSEADIASLDAIQEVMNAYREVTVADRRRLYVSRLEGLRWQAAKVAADLQFIGTFPKYVFEVALVIGGFILAGVLFTTQSTAAAVGTLALFLAAATRVMPSILRLQGAAITLRNAAGIARTTVDLATALEGADAPLTQSDDSETKRVHAQPTSQGFEPSVQLDCVTFTYPGGHRPAIADISLRISPGTSVALVGSSGAGKSTLADLILGVLHPDHGSVRISDLEATDAIRRWPGAIAYVPQDVVLANATIRANVALGLASEMTEDDLVWEALQRARLGDLLASDREGLSMKVGERGVRLSGGQRQRLGIARALYSQPRLLVLDEATSALDAETELAISQTIQELEGSVTTIIIAHRLSTVRHADQVVYLEGGRLIASGSFETVRRDVPAFDRQAEIMGLR